MPIKIRDELLADLPEIRRVNQLAFEQSEEAELVEALREGGFIVASLVAERHGQVVAHVLFSSVRIEEPGKSAIPAALLAPVAVLPSEQGQGIGSLLVREALRACRDVGHRIAIVLGYPSYYARFGFRSELAVPLKCQYSGPALMALELVPGALAGVEGELVLSPPFDALANPQPPDSRT